MAAAAYQSTAQPTSWDQEKLALSNRNLYENPYTYDTLKTNYGSRRPSQQMSALDTALASQEDFKRDSGRTLKSERSPYDTPERSPNFSQPRRPSASNSTSANRPQRVTENAVGPMERSAWIHRDKLARIESREMAEAGFPVHRSTQRRESRSEGRSASRSTSRNHARARSGDRHINHAVSSDEYSTPTLPAFEEYELEAPKDSQDSDEYEERLREEPRRDRQYSRSLPRPVTSRIPIARASPAPVSQDVVERDSPLPRSWQGSAPLDGSMPSRTRSQSLGSQAVINESAKPRTQNSTRQRPRSSQMQESADIASSPSSSSFPPKTKSSTKSAPNSIGRKGTNPVSKTRALSVSNKDSPTNVSRRPTSGSTRSRPTSFHSRPEGEAPWIATMYKPDPRIPQDQQMLPTHAKRIMQEHGHTGDAKDFDFNLLNDNDLAKMGAFPAPADQNQQPNASEATSPKLETAAPPLPWPLTSNNTDTTHQSRRASSGYRITPTIESPASPMPQRPFAQSETPPLQKPAVQRVPDPDEKADSKKKKKFACCVVM